MDGLNIAVAPTMHCFSGIRMNPLAPTVDDIDITDIAHHLSNVCRYGGACKEFYSVAQHSVICSYYGGDTITNRWLLMHDAPEAYIGDIISPLKITEQYEIYREIEENLMRVICEKFKLPEVPPEIVHKVDMIVRHTEMRDFGSVAEECWINEPKLYETIEPVSPKEAEFLFLYRYKELFG